MAEDKKNEPGFDQDIYDRLLDCSKRGKEGIAEWNQWRDDNLDTKILLEGVDLRGVYLKNANLFRAYLKNADLMGARLEKVELVEAHLENADLRNAHLENANLLGAHLENADLTGARLENAGLHGARLKNADLRGAHLENAKLIEAHLENADLRNAHLENVNLRGARLENANLREAHLENAYLSDAHLENAYLGGAHLENANLFFAHLENANLRGAHFENANLSGAHLENANLSLAHLEHANFSNSHVNGATNLLDCTFNDQTDFRNVAIDNMLASPNTKEMLKYNNRRMSWQQWYKKGPWYSRLFKNISIRPFLGLTDYGTSTGKLFKCFIFSAVIFAVLYFGFGAYDYYFMENTNNPGIVFDLFVETDMPSGSVAYSLMTFFRTFYFSIVTMTTLGFGDMYANTDCQGWRWWLGHGLLMIQVILGYFLLGALITRLSQLFRLEGPFTGYPKPKPEPEPVEDQEPK